MSRTITPAQQNYIRALSEELRRLNPEWFAAISAEATVAEASAFIEELKGSIARAKASTPSAATFSRFAAPELVAEGIYRRTADGAMFRVQTSEQGRRYAKLLLPSGGWGYERGAIYTLTASERLTLAQLEEWGLSTGVCAICGRLLSTAESVARGIGPICASRY